MELDADSLTLLLILAVAVWKVRQTLLELKARAGAQLLHSAFGLNSPPATDSRRNVSDRSNRISVTDQKLNTDVARRLEDIGLADASFDAERFLDRVSVVYETVVTAFANGDRGVLRPLLSEEVYETFSREIAARAERGEQLQLSLIGLNTLEIVEASIFNGWMEITVNLEGEFVAATRSDSGIIIAGDPARITTMNDRWTFAKELASPSPAWRLVATESPQADHGAMS